MTILNIFFQFATASKGKNRFFQYLYNSKSFMKKWLWIKWHLFNKKNYPVQAKWPTGKPANNDFWKQNAARAEAILSRMADEKSKQVYTSIIEHRHAFYNKGLALDIYEPLQYFIKEVDLGKDEVFIDCGAFDGDTIDNFIYHCHNYKHIVAFEPGAENFEQLKAHHGNNPKITLINAGVWHKEETLCFSGDGQFGTILAGGGIIKDFRTPAGWFIKDFPHPRGKSLSQLRLLIA